MQNMTVQSNIGKYRPFGAFRFFLSLIVLIQHGLLILIPSEREIFYDLELGVLAVMVFFILSGFIVAEANITFYHGRPFSFLCNRVLRLVPPYLAALLLAVACQIYLYNNARNATLDAPLVGSPLQPLVLLSGVLEIIPGITANKVSGQEFSFIPFAWTLRIEFLFYIIVFVVFWAKLSACWMPSWIRNRVIFFAFTISYLLAAALRMGFISGPQQLLAVPFFALGVVVFLLVYRRRNFDFLHFVLIAGFAVACFTVWRQRNHPIILLQLPLLAILCFAFVALARAQPSGTWWKVWDQRLGALSYPLYLNHGTVLILLLGLSEARGWPAYYAAIPVSIALAGIMNVLVETPLRKVRDRIRGRRLA